MFVALGVMAPPAISAVLFRGAVGRGIAVVVFVRLVGATINCDVVLAVFRGRAAEVMIAVVLTGKTVALGGPVPEGANVEALLVLAGESITLSVAASVSTEVVFGDNSVRSKRFTSVGDAEDAETAEEAEELGSVGALVDEWLGPPKRSMTGSDDDEGSSNVDDTLDDTGAVLDVDSGRLRKLASPWAWSEGLLGGATLIGLASGDGIAFSAGDLCDVAAISAGPSATSPPSPARSCADRPLGSWARTPTASRRATRCDASCTIFSAVSTQRPAADSRVFTLPTSDAAFRKRRKKKRRSIFKMVFVVFKGPTLTISMRWRAKISKRDAEGTGVFPHQPGSLYEARKGLERKAGRPVTSNGGLTTRDIFDIPRVPPETSLEDARMSRGSRNLR